MNGYVLSFHGGFWGWLGLGLGVGWLVFARDVILYLYKEYLNYSNSFVRNKK